MSFCKYCGRELTEGEVCNCKELKTQEQTQKNITKLLVIIGSILMFVACFMPFYSVSALGYSESFTYKEGDGVITIILAIIAIVLAVLNLQKFSLIPVMINLVMVVYDLSQVSDASYGMGHTGMGASVLIISTVIALIGGALAFVWKLKRK